MTKCIPGVFERLKKISLFKGEGLEAWIEEVEHWLILNDIEAADVETSLEIQT